MPKRPVLNRNALCLGCLFAALSTASAGGPPSISLTLESGDTVTGMLKEHDASTCWVVASTGRLHRIDRDDVASFRPARQPFQAASTLVLAKQLEERWGDRYAVVTSGTYVVVAHADYAREILAELDETSRRFRVLFERSAISLDRLEFPLVAIVFDTTAEFAEYAAAEDVDAAGGLVGYYLRTSNRIALTAEHSDSWRDTLVHEAIHQLGFNTGLHARTRDNPIWVVEGLAMFVEGAGLAGSVTSKKADGVGVNETRFRWWREHVQPSWKSGDLAKLTATDALFESAPLDAYAASWAFTYFLSAQRPVEYRRLLRAIRSRRGTGEYGATARVHDLSASLRDLGTIEVAFLRFMDDLAATRAGDTRGKTSDIQPESRQGANRAKQRTDRAKS